MCFIWNFLQTLQKKKIWTQMQATQAKQLKLLATSSKTIANKNNIEMISNGVL